MRYGPDEEYYNRQMFKRLSFTEMEGMTEEDIEAYEAWWNSASEKERNGGYDD